MVKLSLRRSLFGLWFAWTLVALAVAGLTIAVFERGSAALIAKGRSTATAACTAAGARYRLLLASGSASSTADGRERDLAVIMQTSLYQFPGVEGSLWRRDLGFFGYAYPTYEGTVAKTDLPEAERANIETLVSAAALDQATRIDERRGLREAVIIAVCPVTADGNIMAWTLLRVPLAGNDFENLALAAGLVLAFLVGSGLWVAFIGFRWSRAFAGVERTLEKAGAELPNNIAPTGLGELDSVGMPQLMWGKSTSDASGFRCATQLFASRGCLPAPPGGWAVDYAEQRPDRQDGANLKVRDQLIPRPPAHAYLATPPAFASAHGEGSARAVEVPNSVSGDSPSERHPFQSGWKSTHGIRCACVTSTADLNDVVTVQ